LKLNGLISKADGSKLKIVKPDTSAPAPLFATAATPKSDADDVASTPVPKEAAASESPESAEPTEAPAETASEKIVALAAVKTATDVAPPAPPSTVTIAKAEEPSKDQTKA